MPTSACQCMSERIGDALFTPVEDDPAPMTQMMRSGLSGYVLFTADATNASWQVPIKEECYMVPPKEWLESKKDELHGRKVIQEGTVWSACCANRMGGALCRHAQEEKFERCEVAQVLQECGKGHFLRGAYGRCLWRRPRQDGSTVPGEDQQEGCDEVPIHRLGDTYSHLKKVRTYTKEGICVRPDRLQTSQDASSTVAVNTNNITDKDASIFRGCVGILMYVTPGCLQQH